MATKIKVKHKELKEIEKQLDEIIFKTKVSIEFYSTKPDIQAIFRPILDKAEDMRDKISYQTRDTEHEFNI